MKSNYIERKQNRLDYYERQAEKNEKASEDLYKQAKDMADVIPLGQPILVGHHSEKSDRNYRGRIESKFSKAFEANDKAKYYRERVETLLNDNSISSDDPNAIDKLKEKLEKLETIQEIMKDANKIVKRTRGTKEEKIEELKALGFAESTAAKLFEPDWIGRVGFPSYRITNNGANMRRVKDRIAHLEKLAKVETTEREINGATLKVNSEENRIQIFFPGKPSEQTRDELKRSGFRWSPYVGAWMRAISDWGIREAETILSNYKG